MTSIRSVCVYCGSSPGRDPVYVDAGERLGAELAKSDLRLVYGGGTKGIMGAVARGAMENGGKVTGIIPRFLMSKEATETALEDLDDVIITEDMHQRKHLMFEHSDAFVTLPGGIGTVEEIVEILTWAQLGKHTKPMVFANIDGFWQPMLNLLDHMKAEGFVHTADKVRPIVANTVDEIIPAIIAHADGNGGDQEIIRRL